MLLTSPAAAEDSSITRSFSKENPAPNEEFEVILTISGLRAAGIVESIPEGFTYVSTSYPADGRVSVSGQNLVFSVLDDRKIVYRVKAPVSGSGNFEGQWNDILNQKKGTIQASEVSVDPDSKAAEEQEAETEKSPAGIFPVISGVMAAALAVSAYGKRV
ncbi:hypothetical protein [Methanosarcina sp. KYL-1]|uniref:hypothetical protein n=1 Tax=Methanosarcina sp. KYL-1 TaxID=2602068 RepID=UPI00210169DC|nr:hypothetical protein [Methanosarcina sp. KYL-1]